MGKYSSSKAKEKPTISDMLRAAEEDHYLDCPNAELRLRAAALLLDLIIAALVISGLQNLCLALQSHLMHFEKPFLSENASAIAAYVYIALRLAFLYFYFIWSMVFSGGSPGKLVLGLRTVQTRNGSFPTLSTSLAREVTKVLSLAVGGFGLLYLFIGRKNVPFHDAVFDTSVKRIHGRL